MIYFIPLISTICVILFFMWINWLLCQPKDAIYIKFNSFVSFYNINPDRWSLNYDSVDFIKERRYGCPYCIYYKFHFIDFCRYKYWHKKIIKQKSLQKEMNDISEMIRIIKSDIAKFEEENQAKIQSAAENIREITSRM